MTRTTPPRPVDIAQVFPELREHTLVATRLHPRPGAPTVNDSSVGGPLLWPADEPWPMCDASSHDTATLLRPQTVRRRRAILGAAWARTRRGEPLQITDEERAALPDTDASEPHYLARQPIAMVPVAQLYRRDVPGLTTDLLQVLWCPLDHDDLEYCPRILLRRRRAADVTTVLQDPPEPVVVNDDYLPEPCVVHPEQVREYQYADLLPPGLAGRIREWDEDDLYFGALSVASGWKVGGFANWNLSDPRPMDCEECGTAMRLLLRVDSAEWDGEGSWRPVEDADNGEFLSLQSPSTPTAVVIGRGYSLWIFTCPVSDDHPHRTAMQ
ncbi:hypothetical protein [Actinoplanes friuliensis]|uniref:DUF1963 domain-containing protein n=1 Tax=Actinoplanes friuliensis DSM 7358 TaxID=1246995 RepID=U5W3N7_9ACTN|nr:hypothetical protein [Actinoplanes friuliensis]AGZ42536.1 hypothetical protein AFR_21320 [Actinoplanes friuliensis DSM 7358]